MNDITALMATMKAAAEKATPGEWCNDDRHGVIADAGLNGNFYIASCSGPEHRSNAQFIAKASPANVLALVEALEVEQQKSANQGRHACSLFDEVKRLQERLRTVELSNSVLESRPVTPMTYFENSDADHCRQQAWEHVKGEVSTDGWTTGDSVNYFGFFCWGWDMRRQYNEQRTVTVQLPEVRITVAESKRKNLTWRELGAYNEGADVAAEKISKVLTAAGIQVIEGEA